MCECVGSLSPQTLPEGPTVLRDGLLRAPHVDLHLATSPSSSVSSHGLAFAFPCGKRFHFRRDCAVRW